MKKLITLSAMVISLSNSYASQQKCEELHYQAIEQSLINICGSNTEENLNTCHQGGDFAILMQESVYEIMSKLVNSYNKENPRIEINCDDFEYENNN